MTQLESGQPPGARRRDAASAVNRLGLAGSLQAPGRVTPPPVVPGARQSEQLMQALGLTGQLVGQISQMVEQERREAEQVNRAKATLDARKQAPELTAAVAQGKFDSMIGDDVSPGKLAEQQVMRQLVGEDGESVFPASYTEQYRQQLIPAMANALAKRQLQIQTEARQDVLDVLSQGNDPAAAFESAREQFGGQLSEAELNGAVVMPMLQRAVAAVQDERIDVDNAQQQFDAAASVAREHSPNAVQQLRVRFQAAKRARESRIAEAEFAAVRNRVQRQLDAGNTDYALDLVNDRFAGLTDTQRAALRDTVVNTHRTRRMEQLQLDLRQGDVSIEGALDELDAAERRWEEDPNALDALRPNQAQSIRQQLISQRANIGKIDLTMMKAEAKLRGQNVGPLTSADRPGILAMMGNMGVAEVLESPDSDTRTLVRIVDPERAAAIVDKLDGQMPSEWPEQIRRGFEQGGDALPMAMRSLIALHRQTPNVAEQIMSDMSDTARARARTAIDNAPNNYIEQMDELAARVAGVQASSLEARQVEERLFEDRNIAAVTKRALRRNLPDGFDPGLFGPSFPDPDAETAEIFRQEAIKAFRERAGLDEPDDVARENALTIAAARTMIKSKPLLWGGQIIFQRGNLATWPTFQEDVVARLQELRDDGKLSRPPSFYVNNYVPKPVENFEIEVDGQRRVSSGWVLVPTHNRVLSERLPGVFFRFKDTSEQAEQMLIDHLKEIGRELQEPRLPMTIEEATEGLPFGPDFGQGL